MGFDELVVQKVSPADWEGAGQDDFGIAPRVEADGGKKSAVSHEGSDKPRGDGENGLAISAAGERDDAGMVEAGGLEGGICALEVEVAVSIAMIQKGGGEVKLDRAVVGGGEELLSEVVAGTAGGESFCHGLEHGGAEGVVDGAAVVGIDHAKVP